MIVFFDGVSIDGYIGLYDTAKNLIAQETLSLRGNESTQTIGVIDIFLKKQGVGYQDISDIVTVIGPGSFTGIRTITLVVNSLAYIYPHIHLTGISFFDLYTQYPIVKQSSRRDVFVKSHKNGTIEILKNDDFTQIYSNTPVFGDIDSDIFGDITSSASRDYTHILQKIQLQTKKQLAPLYMKKPNIS